MHAYMYPLPAPSEQLRLPSFNHALDGQMFPMAISKTQPLICPPLPAPMGVSISNAQLQFPSAANATGGWSTTGPGAWTSGFFPGVLWQLFNLTGQQQWQEAAEKWTQPLANRQRHWGYQHDFGACSGGIDGAGVGVVV